MSDHPRENLLRASYPAVELRSAGDDPDERPVMSGYFARFNEWTRIDSVAEGTFMERIAPGAFARTIRNNLAQIRVLFQHGRDAMMGDKPLGVPRVLREDDEGVWYEVPLLEGVPELIESGLRAGVYGASFQFSIPEGKDEWNAKPARSPHNPEGIPERTIREARLFEFGPVTWPAYAGATAGVRSLTLSDLDAASAPPEEAAALPDAGPAPLAHSDEGTREADTPAVEPQEGQNVVNEYRTLDEMGARVRELDAEIKRAAELPGILPEPEQVAFDAKVAERAELEHAIAAWRNRLSQVRERAERPENTEGGWAAPEVSVVRRMSEADIYDLDAVIRTSRTPEERSQKLRDNAMRAAEQLRVADARYDQDKSRERLQSLLDTKDSADREIARRVLQTNSPAYRRDFHRYIASAGLERGTALAVGVDGTGGYSVPVAFDPSVVAIGAWTATNPYRASCRVETIAGTDTWQALTSTAVVAAYAAEADAATEQGPTFARPEYIVKRAQGQITTSHEMLADRPDLVAELSVLIGEAKDNLEEAQFTTGVGTTVYPQGIGLKDAFTRVDSVTNDTVAVADVLAVEAALPIRHRLNAAWYLTRKAIRAIQAFETTGGQLFNGTGYPAVGNPVAARTGNTGLTLLGYPVWETPSMPWTPTTDDTTWGVLMDPRNYVIVDRLGLSVRVIPDLINSSALATGQAAIYFSFRNTARVLNVDGGRQGAVQ